MRTQTLPLSREPLSDQILNPPGFAIRGLLKSVIRIRIDVDTGQGIVALLQSAASLLPATGNEVFNSRFIFGNLRKFCADDFLKSLYTLP